MVWRYPPVFLDLFNIIVCLVNKTHLILYNVLEIGSIILMEGKIEKLLKWLTIKTNRYDSIVIVFVKTWCVYSLKTHFPVLEQVCLAILRKFMINQVLQYLASEVLILHIGGRNRRSNHVTKEIYSLHKYI